MYQSTSAAAARGSKIHKEVEIYDNLGIMGESPSAKTMLNLSLTID